MTLVETIPILVNFGRWSAIEVAFLSVHAMPYSSGFALMSMSQPEHSRNQEDRWTSKTAKTAGRRSKLGYVDPNLLVAPDRYQYR